MILSTCWLVLLIEGPTDMYRFLTIFVWKRRYFYPVRSSVHTLVNENPLKMEFYERDFENGDSSFACGREKQMKKKVFEQPHSEGPLSFWPWERGWVFENDDVTTLTEVARKSLVRFLSLTGQRTERLKKYAWWIKNAFKKSSFSNNNDPKRIRMERARYLSGCFLYFLTDTHPKIIPSTCFLRYFR